MNSGLGMLPRGNSRPNYPKDRGRERENNYHKSNSIEDVDVGSQNLSKLVVPAESAGSSG